MMATMEVPAPAAAKAEADARPKAIIRPVTIVSVIVVVVRAIADPSTNPFAMSPPTPAVCRLLYSSVGNPVSLQLSRRGG